MMHDSMDMKRHLRKLAEVSTQVGSLPHLDTQE